MIGVQWMIALCCRTRGPSQLCTSTRQLYRVTTELIKRSLLLHVNEMDGKSQHSSTASQLLGGLVLGFKGVEFTREGQPRLGWVRLGQVRLDFPSCLGPISLAFQLPKEIESRSVINFREDKLKASRGTGFTREGQPRLPLQFFLPVLLPFPWPSNFQMRQKVTTFVYSVIAFGRTGFRLQKGQSLLTKVTQGYHGTILLSWSYFLPLPTPKRDRKSQNSSTTSALKKKYRLQASKGVECTSEVQSSLLLRFFLPILFLDLPTSKRYRKSQHSSTAS